jgi:hypothetical protein
MRPTRGPRWSRRQPPALPPRAPAAMVNLGPLLARQDDPGQVAWFAQAVDTNDTEIAPYAALYLASWYQEQGDLEHTVAAYHQASRMSIPTPRRGPPTCLAGCSLPTARSRRHGRPAASR